MLTFYRNFKNNFGKEMYKTRSPDFHIFPLIKFRCSCHKLEIELGRSTGRLLTWKSFLQRCDMNLLGVEFRFVIECSRYSEIREKVLPSKYTPVKSMFNLCSLFSASKHIQLKFAHFYGSAWLHSNICLPPCNLWCRIFSYFVPLMSTLRLFRYTILHAPKGLGLIKLWTFELCACVRVSLSVYVCVLVCVCACVCMREWCV